MRWSNLFSSRRGLLITGPTLLVVLLIVISLVLLVFHTATLPALSNSRKFLEIDWANGVPIFSSSRSGLGYSAH